MSKVHRSRFVFLAGPTAMHMQLALPEVAHAVDQHGFFRRKPLARLRRTGEAGLNLIFEAANAIDTARGINRIHRGVRGALPETVGSHTAGTEYSATDPKHLKWVAATLVYGSITGYEKFVGPLSQEEKDAYLQEARSFFTLFALPYDSLSPTYDGLTSYINDMIATEQVKVGAIAKELAPYTMLSQTPMRRRLMRILELATKYTLPEALLEQYGYTFSLKERKTIEHFAANLKNVTPYIPNVIKEVPQYRAASTQKTHPVIRVQ